MVPSCMFVIDLRLPEATETEESLEVGGFICCPGECGFI